MPGYLKRLARQTGLLPREHVRAPSHTGDIVEINEERVIGESEALAPRASNNAEPQRTSVTSEHAVPISRLESPLVPGAAALGAAETKTAVPARTPRMAASTLAPHRPSRPTAAERIGTASPPASVIDSVGDAEPSPAGTARAASMDVEHVAPFARAASGIEARLASADSLADTPRDRAPLAVSAEAARTHAAQVLQPTSPQATAAVVVPSPVHGDTTASSVRTASVPLRPSPVIATAMPPATSPAAVPRDRGTQVHIGRIDLAIHTPPRPAPIPLYRAPEPAADSSAPADSPFSAHRHYLRGSA